jgi:hypothetical protein
MILTPIIGVGSRIPLAQPWLLVKQTYVSHAVLSPSPSSAERYPGSHFCMGAAPAARAAAQFL